MLLLLLSCCCTTGEISKQFLCAALQQTSKMQTPTMAAASLNWHPSIAADVRVHPPVCVCVYSQALGVAGDVGRNLCDPGPQLVAEAHGSFGQAGLNSRFNVHLRARRRGCCRLYHHNHYHYQNHHHHHCSLSAVQIVDL